MTELGVRRMAGIRKSDDVWEGFSAVPQRAFAQSEFSSYCLQAPYKVYLVVLPKGGSLQAKWNFPAVNDGTK